MTDAEDTMNADTDEGLDAMLSALPYPDIDRGFDDALLHRYRRGELDDDGRAKVEQLLLDSPRARAVLAEAARPVDEALLSRLERVVSPNDNTNPTVTRWGFIAVAAALVASVVGLMLRPSTPDFAPAYGVATVGGTIKEVRDENGLEPGLGLIGPLRFTPDGRLEVLLQPLEGHSGGTPSVHVFHVDADGRLVPVHDVGIDRGPGGIRIQGKASDLLGDGLGPRQMHVVFTPEGTPSEVAGRPASAAREEVCADCWLTLDAELVARP